ncbi:hypothetical protein FDP41_002805 [Naegleria fowleri]|uniref:DOC domain-containing protein n=1 Tax=Naegleria fowleri TaxID=5763 RepID=A0A6A5BXE4_NAEFO|nr:uncharacterized protein FDP41_002805 [Naegleria fowleri]KAF0978290.1 hypothetical protein FDP41_002805 [Naegleria fowleri]CAG4710611.1 unnamed protein product [Naegleria fowleri]
MFRLSQLSSSLYFSFPTTTSDDIGSHHSWNLPHDLFTSSSSLNPHGLSPPLLLEGGGGGGGRGGDGTSSNVRSQAVVGTMTTTTMTTTNNTQQPQQDHTHHHEEEEEEVHPTTTTAMTNPNRISFSDFARNHSFPSISSSSMNEQQQFTLLSKYSSMIEIGKYAVWSVSTAKQGNGVEQLRDDNCETFWQSDGPQPHYINIQFHKVLSVQDVLIYLDYKKDESYTPQTISIRCGTSFHDLTHVKTVELEEPVGYICINMSDDEKDNNQTTSINTTTTTTTSSLPHGTIRCNMLQIVISQNHQNGRDTHVRQVKVYGPIEHASSGSVVGNVAITTTTTTTITPTLHHDSNATTTNTTTMRMNPYVMRGSESSSSSVISYNDPLNGGAVASSMLDQTNTIHFSMFSTLR